MVVMGVHVPGQNQLALIFQTLKGLRVGLGPGQGGQQQRRQNGNGCDNDKQLNKRESNIGFFFNHQPVCCLHNHHTSNKA